MARLLNRLSARHVETLKEPGLYADGGNLYLRIDKAGAKRWTFIYRWRGKRKEMGLGPVRTFRLADARQAAESARKQVAEGVDPAEARRASRAVAMGLSFGQVADEVVEALKPGWKNPKHAAQWEMTLREYVPFRDKPIAEIDTDDVKKALVPIWLTTPETASRLRGRIERVLDVAKARGLRIGENPARWRGHLAVMLPKQPKLTRGHHAALAYAAMPTFMADLRARHAMAARALEFTILTASRTSETLEARWSEIDLEEGVWTVPPERMKAGREHRVPLEQSALALLRVLKLPKLKPSDLVFPGPKRGKPLSTGAMERVLDRMEVDATVHGFRSSFSDWAHEQTQTPDMIIEMCLAHVVGSETSRAYRRGDAFNRRRDLMRLWDQYLVGPADQSSVPIPSGE